LNPASRRFIRALLIAPLVGHEVRIEIPDGAGHGDGDQRKMRAEPSGPSGWHMLSARGHGGELGGADGADGADARTSH